MCVPWCAFRSNKYTEFNDIFLFERQEENEDVDYKKAAGFHRHMKKTEALSNFSKTKTMAEQREFLPIFQVKEDLLRVIRDNQARKRVPCIEKRCCVLPSGI